MKLIVNGKETDVSDDLTVSHLLVEQNVNRKKEKRITCKRKSSTRMAITSVPNVSILSEGVRLMK